MSAELLESEVVEIVSALRGEGWCLRQQWLAPDLCAVLREDLLRRVGAMVPAAVGRGGERRQADVERGDRTLWLDGEDAAQRRLLEQMSALRLALNRELLLGLFDYEAHYAHYPPGAFYRRHLDTFRERPERQQPRRVLSTVFYLNDGWQEEDGGELVLWRGDCELARIAPCCGTAVFFLSDEFPHEVLPAAADRHSIAGWFRSAGAR